MDHSSRDLWSQCGLVFKFIVQWRYQWPQQENNWLFVFFCQWHTSINRRLCLCNYELKVIIEPGRCFFNSLVTNVVNLEDFLLWTNCIASLAHVLLLFIRKHIWGFLWSLSNTHYVRLLQVLTSDDWTSSTSSLECLVQDEPPCNNISLPPCGRANDFAIQEDVRFINGTIHLFNWHIHRFSHICCFTPLQRHLNRWRRRMGWVFLLLAGKLVWHITSGRHLRKRIVQQCISIVAFEMIYYWLEPLIPSDSVSLIHTQSVCLLPTKTLYVC